MRSSTYSSPYHKYSFHTAPVAMNSITPWWCHTQCKLPSKVLGSKMCSSKSSHTCVAGRYHDQQGQYRPTTGIQANIAAIQGKYWSSMSNTQHCYHYGKCWISLCPATYHLQSFYKNKPRYKTLWCCQRRDLTALAANAASPFLDRRDVIVQGLTRMTA